MSLEEDINCNLDRYTHYYTKCCDTDEGSLHPNTRQNTFSNETIRKVMNSAKGSRPLVTRRNSHCGRINLSHPFQQPSLKAELLRSSLICTSFGIKDETLSTRRKKLRLEDLLKRSQTPPLQLHSTNRPKRIEILGLKVGCSPFEGFTKMQVLPTRTPTAKLLQFEQEITRPPSKNGRSCRPKFFGVTL